ncbi:hypothetical protein H1R20_g16110, partial [Candolleomyces eurysporus]
MSASWPNDGYKGAFERFCGFENPQKPESGSSSSASGADDNGLNGDDDEDFGNDAGFWDYYARCSVVGEMQIEEHVHALNLVQMMMITPKTRIGITDEGLYTILSTLDSAYSNRSEDGKTGILNACAAASQFKGVPRPLMAMCLQRIVVKHENAKGN